MYALRHKRVPTPAVAGNGPPSERGVVLLVALIILVALTLAGVALIRSVDTANIIAGNLSFRESAVHSGERGTEAARATIQGGGTALYEHGADGSGYRASIPVPDFSSASVDEFWRSTLSAQSVLAPPPAGTTCPSDANADQACNSVRYVIHRLCEGTGAPHMPTANCAKPPASANTGGSFSAGGPAQIASNQVYYRITTRITGPRNTVAYLQTVVAL